MGNDKDLILFSSIKQGNSLAFDNLFRKYYAQLSRFAFKYLLSKDLAEEVVQDVFVHAWENRETIEINISVKAFLYTSVKNRALNQLKKEQTRDGHEEHYFSNYLSSQTAGSEIPDQDQMKKMILQGVETLPPKCAEIFCLAKLVSCQC